jgi:hypothetical protein
MMVGAKVTIVGVDEGFSDITNMGAADGDVEGPAVGLGDGRGVGCREIVGCGDLVGDALGAGVGSGKTRKSLLTPFWQYIPSPKWLTKKRSFPPGAASEA